MRAVATRPWVILALVAVAGLAWWAAGTRRQEHELRAVFAAAAGVRPGLDVQIDGVDVGKVTGVRYEDGQAIVGLGIEDDAWPLPHGTEATLRFGTTIGNATRTVALEPGPPDAPRLPEGGIIGSESTFVPVEFDEVFNTLDARSRAHLRSLIGRTGRTLHGRAERLGEGLAETGPALESLSSVSADLAVDEAALRGLVANAHRATRVLGTRRAQVSDLVTVAAATFDELARNSQAAGSAIEELPDALDETRGTLARLESTSDRLDALVRAVRPGAARLGPLAAATRAAARELRPTAPLGVEALRRLRLAAPPVTRLLDEGVPFAGELDRTLTELTPLLACVRPYAPELAGFLSNWSSLSQNYDATAHYSRFHILGGVTALGSSPDLTSDTVARTFGLDYGLPRPPGDGVNQPWLLPECGAGPEALDPARDPEDRR